MQTLSPLPGLRNRTSEGAGHWESTFPDRILRWCWCTVALGWGDIRGLWNPEDMRQSVQPLEEVTSDS